MQKTWKLAGLVAVLSAGLAACPQPQQPPADQTNLTMIAKVRRLDGTDMSTDVTVEAFNATGGQGTGSVTVKAAAGLLEGTAKELTLALSAGKATTSFSCNRTKDPLCKGAVKLEAKWNDVTTSTTVTVDDPPDGGTGTDGGTGDGGTGTPDAGQAYKLALSSDKQVLIAKTGDNTQVTAVLKRADGTPVANAQVTFATTIGSFAPNAGTLTITKQTDATGTAQAQLSVANFDPGNAQILVTAFDASAQLTVNFLSVSTMFYVSSPDTKSLLGLESSGRETTSPIYFKVIDANQQPVANVNVSFSVTGAGGASVTPSATSNSSGIVVTTLRSGNQVGVAIVKAVVTATINSTPPVTASHPGTSIVGGKPSERGFVVDCVVKNLPALHPNKPTGGLATNCSAKLIDRFSNPVGLPTPVQWYAEAGSINSPATSGGDGIATTTFSTLGAAPYAVTPMPGERFSGSPTNPNDPNPRDMAVTVIAVVAGEEDFYDGSGTNGKINGVWDPGEWFVDLGEPLLDKNDNGVWDPGEDFIDTERIDCANPGAPAVRNNKWDGPNGCWDGNTQIWRPVHLVYSGPLNGTFTFSPQPPFTVPVGPGTTDFSFVWSDAYFNRSSNEGSIGLGSVTGVRTGGMQLFTGTFVSPYGGFAVDYPLRVGTTNTTDGGIILGGLCDVGASTPFDAGTPAPVPTRCVRVADFSFDPSVAPGGTPGTVRLSGAPPQNLLPDGGYPTTPTPARGYIQSNHPYSPSIIQEFDIKYQ